MQGASRRGCASAAFNPKIVSRQTVSIGAQGRAALGRLPRVFAVSGFSAGGSRCLPARGVPRGTPRRASGCFDRESPTASHSATEHRRCGLRRSAGLPQRRCGPGTARRTRQPAMRAGPHPDRTHGRPRSARRAGRRTTRPRAHQARMGLRRRGAVDAACARARPRNTAASRADPTTPIVYMGRARRLVRRIVAALHQGEGSPNYAYLQEAGRGPRRHPATTRALADQG